MSTARSIRCSSARSRSKSSARRSTATPKPATRFLREARAAGQLSHRNIVTIYDLGEHDGHPFLAMEYLEGEDLQQRLSGHVKMSLARKVDLAIDICEGLEYAHAHGVVHRDVKPANVFITTSGQVKILDFGLARLMTSQLTNSNMLMGTLNYMAPEQVRGERADHRADIFSVGVLFYELLCNKKAFEGDSFASTHVQDSAGGAGADLPGGCDRAPRACGDCRARPGKAARRAVSVDDRAPRGSAALSRPDSQERQRRACHLADPARTRRQTRSRCSRPRRHAACRTCAHSDPAPAVRVPPVATVRRHAIGRGSVGRRRAGRHATVGVGRDRVARDAVAIDHRRRRCPGVWCDCVPWFLTRHQPPEAAPQKIEQPAPPIDMSDAVATAPAGRSTRMTTPRPSGRRRPYCSRRRAIARRGESWTAPAARPLPWRTACARRARRSLRAISRPRRVPPATS